MIADAYRALQQLRKEGLLLLESDEEHIYAYFDRPIEDLPISVINKLYECREDLLKLPQSGDEIRAKGVLII